MSKIGDQLSYIIGSCDGLTNLPDFDPAKKDRVQSMLFGAIVCANAVGNSDLSASIAEMLSALTRATSWSAFKDELTGGHGKPSQH